MTVRGVPGLDVNQSERLRDQRQRVMQSANVLFGFDHLIASARRESFGKLTVVAGHGHPFFLWESQEPGPAVVVRTQLVKLGTGGSIAARRGDIDIVFSLTTATTYGTVDWLQQQRGARWRGTTVSPVVAWTRFHPSSNMLG